MTISLWAADGVELGAARYRQSHAAQYGGGSGRRLGGRSGFRVDTPSNVLTATSTTWTLGPCAAMIDPGASTHQGMYGWSTDTNVTGSVTAADATYGRKDIVYIQVNDSSAGDGSGALSAPVQYLAGTPSASPVAPSLPARSFLVGTITVPVAGGGSPTVALNPARFVSSGGLLPVGQVERDALSKYDGLTVLRTDVAGRPAETWDGTKWNQQVRANIGQGSAGPVFAGGVVSVATNVGGDFTISLPTPFDNALVSATVQDATDPAILGGVFLVKVTMVTSDRTKITGRAYTSAGTAFASTTLSMTYMAFGY